MRVLWPGLFGLALLAAGSVAQAAPLPRLDPVDVCGIIRSARSLPEQHLPAVPGASGSLGHDRTVPAHARVLLNPYRGVPRATARKLTRMVGGDAARGLLLLLPGVDPARLAAGRLLCVTGYRLRGDEGLTRALRTSLTVE